MPTATESGIALHTVNPADRVALRGVRVRARLSGLSQRTTVEQTFVNREEHPIEAVYTFPLPESAAVCGFEVVTGDRVLTGTIDEAEQAVEKYEEAVSQGHGAFMVEQDRPDVFTVRVGNLKPKQAATIRLTYVALLEKADKSIRLAFPTAVAPRYTTDTGTDPLDALIDGEALNPPHVLSVPYGLSLEVEIDLGRDLKLVTSPSHAIRTQKTEAGTTLVTLAAGVTEMNRDIVLELALAKEHQPAVQMSAGANGESYLAVTFVPEFDEDDLTDPQPVETVFLLDCSGSMQGSSIEQAVAALELCLRSLSPGDTFNICRFGSTFELLATEPLPYTQSTLDKALRYIHQDADLGGTELHPPLEAILKTKPKSGQIRQLILLTDGQVTNEPAVVDLARKHRGHNRIFSFGIGAGASQFLVKGVARATGGAAEFITEGERIEEKVLRTFARLASPMVSDVSIDWGGAEVQTLAELPPIFDGDLLAVFGRTAGKPPKQVTLNCVTASGPKKWSLPVGPATQDDGVIATMWARRTIQSMEEVNGPLIRSRRGKLTREQKLLVSISKEYNLLCGLTTFIAIEHRSVEERNEGKPELRRVPVALVKDWGGVTNWKSLAKGGCNLPAAPCAAPQSVDLVEMDAGSGLLDLTRESDDTALGAVLEELRPASPAPMPPQRTASTASGGSGIGSFFGSIARKMRSSKKQSPDRDLVSLSDADNEFVPAPPPPSAANRSTIDRSISSLDKTITIGAGGGDDDVSEWGPLGPGDAPLVRLLRSMLLEAVRAGADQIVVSTDLTPAGRVDRMQLHYRVNGQMVERDKIPGRMYRPIVRLLKTAARVDASADPTAPFELTVPIQGIDLRLRITLGSEMAEQTITIDLPSYDRADFAPSAEELQAVLRLQAADGSFDWTMRVDSLVPVDRREAPRAVMPTIVNGANPLRVLQTTLIVLLLADRFPEHKTLWQRARQKAVRQYLAPAFGMKPAEVDVWLATVGK